MGLEAIKSVNLVLLNQLISVKVPCSQLSLLDHIQHAVQPLSFHPEHVIKALHTGKVSGSCPFWANCLHVCLIL